MLLKTRTIIFRMNNVSPIVYYIAKIITISSPVKKKNK